MACDLASGIAFPCKDAIGGIKDVYFIALDDAAFGAASAGVVSAITAIQTVYKYELLKNTGSFVQTVNDTMANGGLFYSQALTIQFPKLTSATSTELHNLLQSRVCVIVRDSNNNTHIMGFADGAEVTGGSMTTGTAKGDLQGYELTFLAEEEIPAPYFYGEMEKAGTGSGLGFDITVETGGTPYTIATA